MAISDGRDQAPGQASARWFEKLDLTASPADHTVSSLPGGFAKGCICDTAGEILKIDSTVQTGYTTVALQAGYNPIEIVKVYATGSTVAGNIDLVSW